MSHPGAALPVLLGVVSARTNKRHHHHFGVVPTAVTGSQMLDGRGEDHRRSKKNSGNGYGTKNCAGPWTGGGGRGRVREGRWGLY
jgi:hypothetical protein